MPTVTLNRLPQHTRDALRTNWRARQRREDWIDRLAFDIKEGKAGAVGRYMAVAQALRTAGDALDFRREVTERDWWKNPRTALSRRGFMRSGLSVVGLLSLTPTQAQLVAGGSRGSTQPSAPEAIVEGAFHVDPGEVSGEAASDLNDGMLASEGGTGPWATLDHALSQLGTSGGVGDSGYDVLYLRGATYTRRASVITDLNSGGSTDTGYGGAKIRVIGFPGETAIINFKGQGICWIRHLANGGNWSWEDIVIHCDFHAFSVDGAFSGGSGVHFKRVKQPDVAPRYTAYRDNSGTVYAWFDADGLLIEDCDFRGTHSEGANASCFFCESNEKFWIRRSIFHNQGAGPAFHFKHPPRNLPATNALLLEFSLCYNAGGRGAWHNGPAGMVLSHVILDGGNRAKAYGGGDGGTDGFGINRENTFDHVSFVRGNCNVFRGNAAGVSNGQGNSLRNSLFTNLLDIWGDFAPRGVTHNTQLNYNCYDSREGISEYGANRRLAAWRNYYGQDANSVEGTASFAAMTDPTDPTTYALDSTSVGAGSADDGSDCGANAALVGPQSKEIVGNRM